MAQSRTVPLSVRIPAEDAAFLAELKIEGAITPSDKLRAIIAHARRLHEGQEDYNAGLAWIRGVLTPAMARVRAGEHKDHIHSEFVSSAAEWLPQSIALILAHRESANSKQALMELEKTLADRVFHFVEAVMRLGVTPDAPCYDKTLIAKRVGPVLELAQLIRSGRK